MKMDDKLFKEIASLYAEHEGQALRLEMEGIPRMDTAGLDRRVRREVTRLRLRPIARPALLAAACLVLALLLPRALAPSTSNITAPSAEEAVPETAQLQMFDAAEAPVEYDIPEMEMGGYDGLMGQEGAGYADEAITGGAEDEAPEHDVITFENPVTAGGGDIRSGAAEAEIPLSFALPQEFYVLWSEEDNGQSVYYMGNAVRDDVVLTMRHMDGPLDTDSLGVDGFGAMELEGREVYYKYTADYSILAFENHDIYYELSCRHDLATLLYLVGHII